jgi:hypothetical protein
LQGGRKAGATGLEPALYPHRGPEAEELLGGCPGAIRLKCGAAHLRELPFTELLKDDQRRACTAEPGRTWAERPPRRPPGALSWWAGTYGRRRTGRPAPSRCLLGIRAPRQAAQFLSKSLGSGLSKRRAQRSSQSSLSKKNFQSLMTPCLTNRNGTGDWNDRKPELEIAVPSLPS